MFNLHNFYLKIYIWFVCLVCWQYFNNPNPLGCVQNRIQIGGFGTVRVKEIHSIVIQSAFGNPTGGTVNWFYFI